MTSGRSLAIFVALAGLATPALAQTADNISRELLADAANRSSFSAAAGGGWEKGSFFISDGGANTLTPYGFTQFRYLMNFRDEDSAGDQDDFTHGFQARRTRVGMKGTVWSKNLSFDMLGEFSRSSGAFTLLDAWGQYKFENNMAIKWGQGKVGLLREELVSDTKQLTLERSTVNSVFTQGRSQMVQLAYTGESFRGWASISDGLNTLNTDFNSASEADYALTARGEFRWGDGDWKRFDDNVSWRGSKYGGMLGAAVHFQDGGETGGTSDTQVLEATVDASMEGNGWNLFAAAVWRNTDASGSDSDDFGAVLQGGYLVSDQCEVFLRYDGVFPDDDSGGDDFHTLTAGANYYLSPESHAAKFSADIQYYFDAEDAAGIISPSTGSNLLADTEDGQIALRLQMQVLF
ncbi:MAG: hypothetical protein IT433_11880 [Phycisphaerales bacterium]|nr:hypothetical protein [Phycisphaerales bacterium]